MRLHHRSTGKRCLQKCPEPSDSEDLGVTEKQARLIQIVAALITDSDWDADFEACGNLHTNKGLLFLNG